MPSMYFLRRVIDSKGMQGRRVSIEADELIWCPAQLRELLYVESQHESHLRVRKPQCQKNVSRSRRIQTFRGFVGEEDIRTSDDGPGNCKPPGLSTRESSAPGPDTLGKWVIPQNLGEADEPEDLIESLVIDRRVAEAEVLGH